MKIRFYLAMMAAALVMTNCSKEEELVQEKKATKGFSATIEGASRSDVDATTGAFSWTAGDKISVWNGSTFDVYANSEEDVTYFAAEDQENAGEATDYAIYPSGSHSISNDAVTVNLPATYTHGSTNAPMLATIEEGSTNLAFKHLAGVMRFVVKNVPAGASSFVFTATDGIITGNYSVNDGQICQDGENTASSTNNNVTITFTELTEKADGMVFYVPLPVGTYGNYTVAIKGTNVDLSHPSTGVTNTIGRRTLLLMPEFSVENGELKKGEGNVIPVTQEEVALSGNQSVTISTTGADTEDVLDINYTPQEGNATLNITDGSSETTSQESVAKIKINPQSESPIESLSLNTPTLTAELGAGQYGTVEALTAQQTLIIGNGVTIEELVLNGGALEITEGATATISNIIVKDELGLRSAIAVGGKVTLQADITLTGYDKWLEIGKECEIDLNGYSIKHAESTVIKIFPGGKLTIGGEGTVETTDQACGAISNLGGTLIINGGTYKSIGAGTIYCDRGEGATWNLTINGGTFEATNSTAVSLQNNNGETDEEKGLADINGGTFTAESSTAVSLQNNNGETDEKKGLAEIKGGTFTGATGWHDLYLANVIADIDTEECTFTNNKVYLLTAGPAIDGGNGTWGSVINDVAYEPGEVGNGYISNF